MGHKNLEVIRQERLKVRLENRLIPEVRALLNRMYRDLRVLYAAGGFIPDVQLYESDWEALLANHYRRVGNEFIGIEHRAKFLTNVKQVEDEVTASGILAAYLLWSKQRAPAQTDFILNTTKANIDEAIEEAKMQAPADIIGPELNIFVATAAAAILRSKIAQRTAIIANVETQAPAEQAKLFTAQANAGIAILPLQQVTVEPRPVQKEWNTVGDERVRRAHANADFQQRDQDKPFNVGGEQLKYPGDTSLGASLGNIINCRCAALYSQG